MVLSRETFEKIKDDLYVNGLFLYVKPKLDISLGVVEQLVTPDNLGFEGNYDPEALSTCDYPYLFENLLRLDEFVNLYDSVDRKLCIREACSHHVEASLMLCAVNPKCPSDGVSDSFLGLHQADHVPISDNIPDLALYVKTYFKMCFIDRKFHHPEQVLHELFPESYPSV